MNRHIDLPPLLPCPFCGWVIPQHDDDDMLDVLYPSGIWWREEIFNDQTARTYHSLRNRLDTDKMCWEIHCTECMGGCGATLTADTIDDLVQKWNRRI